MNYKIINYKDASKKDWDGYVRQLPDANYYHSWSWLNYISKFPGIKENLSFVCLSDNGSVLAVCSLAVSLNGEKKYFEMSFGGNFCGAPAIADVKPSLRRKISDEVFSIISANAEKFKVKKINMIWDPLTIAFCEKSGFHKNHFELLRYGLNYYVENVVVVDLMLPKNILFDNLSIDRRQRIRIAVKKDIKISAFNKENEKDYLKKYFQQFQSAHFQSAGRMTRPQETWDAMYESAKEGVATLFIAFKGNTPISYLYCGEFQSMAFSWSQVNVEQYEKEYSPRHILEWEAILFYKKLNFKYYEIGERYYGPQIGYTPNKKEISISVFKDRFGGILLPKLKWFGYCDQKLLAKEVNKNMTDYIQSKPLFKRTEY